MTAFIGKYANTANGTAELAAYNKSIGFSSSFDLINSKLLTTKGNDTEISLGKELDSIHLSPISEPLLASIINSDHEIQIGKDSIIRIQNDFSFLYKQKDEGLIRDFYLSLKKGVLKLPETRKFFFKGMRVYKTEVTSYELINQDAKKGDTQLTYCEVVFPATSGQPPLRMVGLIISNIYYEIASVRLETWMNHYGDGKWTAGWNADRLSVTFDINLTGPNTYPYYGFIGNFKGTQTDFNRDNLTVYLFQGASPYSLIVNGWACHVVSVYTGYTRKCTTEYNNFGAQIGPVSCPCPPYGYPACPN